MLLVLGLGLPLALVAGLAGVLHSAAGTAWLLGGLPGLKVERPRGALLGTDFAADRVEWTWPAYGRLDIENLSWSGARWRWWLSAHLWAGVEMDTLSAQRVRWQSAPDARPIEAPDRVRLPIQWRASKIEIRTLDVDGVTAHALAAELMVGDNDGRDHHLRGIQMRTGQAALTGAVQVYDRASPTVSMQLDARSVGVTPWRGTLRADGPLVAARVSAQMQEDQEVQGGQGAAGASASPRRPVASLEAEALVRPFDRWPLGTLSLRLKALDLSTLWSEGPRTELSGRAEIRSAGRDLPATADVDIGNDRPNRWDRGGLPLRRAVIRLSAVPGRADAVEFSQAEVELASGNTSAGRLQGQGRWDAQGLDLNLRLTGLRPQSLHADAAALTLSGPLRARLSGLPGPAALRTPEGVGVDVAPRDWKALALELQTELDGEGQALQERVRVVFEGQWAGGRLAWNRFEAVSGNARAESRGELQRDAQGAWRARSEGRLDGFDPARWWPGPAGGPWRQGRNALNASWQADLAWPRTAGSLPLYQRLQSLEGEGTVRVTDSTLAGIDLNGRLSFGPMRPGTDAAITRLDGEFTVGNNRIQVRGQSNPSGTGADDRWDLLADGKALQDLAPLARLHPALAPWAPRGGRLRAQVAVEGRWPQLATEGELSLAGLAAGTVAIERSQVRWQARHRDRPSGDLQVDATGVQWGRTRLDAVRAQLDGTFGQHRATLKWTAPIALPTVVAHVLGLNESSVSDGEVWVEGGWTAEPDGSGQWNGQVRRILATHPGTGPITERTAWLDARDIRTRADFAPGGRLSALQIDAGRARIGPELRLRWDEIGYRLNGERRDFELGFEVEPTQVAPMLQRADTGLIWSGDLTMGLKARVRASRELQAEVLLQRLGGDLLVGDENDRQALGLTESALSLSVDAGLWRFAPLLTGSTLGTISGSFELRTRPEARWPDADAGLSGALQAQVKDLSIWSAWVPPGWGLSGRLSTTAGLGGRLEAPELTGALRADDIVVRNLLQGIAFRDGRARIALRGDRAQIEQLELRGGDGTLRIDGDADIGLQPQARLRLEARQLTLLGRLDRQLTVTGEGTLDLRRDRLDLRGRLGVDRGLMAWGTQEAPTLDSDVIVTGPERNERPASASTLTSTAPRAGPARPAPSLWMRRSSVALDLDLGRQLRVRGRGVDTTVEGQLKVGVQEGRLAVNGAVDARGGTYTAYGQKLDIDRGRVQFTGAPDNPRLDLLALRPKTDMRVGLAILGTAQNPRVRLYSDPEMGERDKLSWLVLGRGAEGLGRTDTTVLQRAALALLSGEQEAPTDAFLRALGIDELTFGQTDGDVRETVVGLGKQLGRNWYVGYERGVNATVGTWQLIYRLAQRFTLRARSGQDPSLDVIWTWRFDRAGDGAEPSRSTGVTPSSTRPATREETQGARPGPPPN